MNATDNHRLKDNVSAYRKTIWFRVPALVLVGSIQVQHSGFFHYVGYALLAWAFVEAAVYLYGMRAERKISE